MKKDFFWNTLGYGLYCFAYSILLVLVTRICGLDTAGIFSVLYATVNIIYQLALYGGKTYYVTDKEHSKYVDTYLVTRLFSAIFSVVVVAILGIVFDYDLNTTIIFFMLCLTKIIDAISDFYHGFLQVHNKLYLVGVSLLSKTIVSIIVFGLSLYFTHSLLVASISLVIVALLFLLLFDCVLTSKISTIKITFNKEKMLSIIKECFFLFCGNVISSYLINIPKYILAHFVNDAEQGVFGILIMPAFVVVTFASFVVQPFLVELTEAFEKNLKLYIKKVVKLCEVIFLIFLFVLGVGYLVGLPVMSFIFSENLEPYKVELIIVILSSLLHTMTTFIITNLTIIRKVGSLLFLNIIVGIIGTITTYFIVKLLGLFGGYIGFFIIVLVQFILFAIYYIMQMKLIKKTREEK